MEKQFIADKYQQEVFKAVEAGGQYIVSSAPGSGKTATVVNALPFVPKNAKVLCTAFNVSAAEEIANRAAPLATHLVHEPVILNIHKVGGKTLIKNDISYKIDKSKYYKLAKQFYIEVVGVDLIQLRKGAFETEINAIVATIEKARICLTDETDAEALANLARRFDLGFDPDEDDDEQICQDVFQALPWCIAEGVRLGSTKTGGFVIDLTDMIWLPVRLELRAFEHFDYLFLDEAQDFSPCEQNLLLACGKRDANIFIIGDRHQSINQWKGADARSMDNMKGRLAAAELNLSVCYRCPRTVIDLANDVFPGSVLPAPGAPEGKVVSMPTSAITSIVKAGDRLLGRWNRELVETAIALLLDGHRVCILGRDLGKTIKATMTKLAKHNKSFSADTFLDLKRYVDQYRAYQMNLIAKTDEENREEAAEKWEKLDDQFATLELLFDAYRACFDDKLQFIESATFAKFTRPVNKDKYNKVISTGDYPTYPNLANFLVTIDNFFVEDPKAQIILSTIHKSKGQQNPRIIILNFDQLPSRKLKKNSKRKSNFFEEQCLEYVAITRAQEELILALAEPEKEAPRLDETIDVIGQVTVTEEIAPMLALPEPAEVNAPAPKAKGRPASGKADEKGRIRQKWQGTYDRRTLAFLDALVNDGAIKDKSKFVEEMIQSSPLFAAWSAANPENGDDQPDPDGNGGGAPAPEASEATTDQEGFNQPSEEAPTTLRLLGKIINLADYGNAEPAAEEEYAPVEAIEAEPVALFDDQVKPGEAVRIFFKCRSIISKWGAEKKDYCNHRWGRDYTIDEAGQAFRIDEAGQRRTPEDDRKPCSKCGKEYVSLRRLVAKHNDSHKCTPSCKNATSDECECACGAANHGVNKMVGPILYTGVKPIEVVK